MPFIDRYPQKTKILFIGLLESSHTQNWLTLVDGETWNVRLFAMPTGFVKHDWRVQTYLAHPHPPERLDPNVYSCLYQLQKDQSSSRRNRFASILRPIYNFAHKAFLKFNKFVDSPYTFQEIVEPRSPEAWLATIIQEWQPDIIHTLGIFDQQGGEFYYEVRKKYHLESSGKWVLQTRGGSDLMLRRHDPSIAQYLTEIMQESDAILCDNLKNLEYACALGVNKNKFASINPVPGSGGIDTNKIKSIPSIKTSARRAILIPKAYECMWSKSLPILEALKICWKDIQPCHVYFLAVDKETLAYIRSLPIDMQQNITVQGRISHLETLQLMSKSRIMLAPSLVDGIPNSLYEAMATGALPIVSPIETISTLVKDGENVLFAQNLYPVEISDALTIAMTNNDLVDRIVHQNYSFVETVANRDIVRKKVVKFYQSL